MSTKTSIVPQMSTTKIITQILPVSPSNAEPFSYEAMIERSGFKEVDGSTPIALKHSIIREEYARKMADFTAGGLDYVVNPEFIGWNYEWTQNAQSAWFCLKAEGVSMYPLFPFLHYFLDFADPFRKIAVLVEEDDAPWNEAFCQEQDKLLTLGGWMVYRIPSQVANTLEASLLPEHLQRCPYGEFDDDEQLEEYQQIQENLNTKHTTVDGFFTWLKKEVYYKK